MRPESHQDSGQARVTKVCHPAMVGQKLAKGAILLRHSVIGNYLDLPAGRQELSH